MILVIAFTLLLPIYEILAESPCFQADREVLSLHLEKIKKNFYEDLNAHYKLDINNLSAAELKKMPHLKRYRKPTIKVFSNPRHQNQKIVYVEYEKNWWGNLYYSLFDKSGKIAKWKKVETHGATTVCIRWKKDGQRFFYEDMTHAGHKTKNICFVQEGTVNCKKE